MAVVSKAVHSSGCDNLNLACFHQFEETVVYWHTLVIRSQAPENALCVPEWRAFGDAEYVKLYEGISSARDAILERKPRTEPSARLRQIQCVILLPSQVLCRKRLKNPCVSI